MNEKMYWPVYQITDNLVWKNEPKKVSDLDLIEAYADLKKFFASPYAKNSPHRAGAREFFFKYEKAYDEAFERSGAYTSVQHVWTRVKMKQKALNTYTQLEEEGGEK